METISHLERKMVSALVQLWRHKPFTPKFNKVVAKIYSQDTELNQSFASNDRKETILLLKQRRRTLNESISRENITQDSMVSLYEKICLIIIMERLHIRCTVKMPWE